MDNKILIILLMIAVPIVVFLYNRLIYKDKDDKGPKLTGPATVKSHRVEQGRYLGKAPSRWNFIVTFTLSDGEELELYTFEEHFRAMKDGISGQLTWQGKNFLEFDTDD